MERLRRLPPRKFLSRTRNGQRYYLYADPDYCQCVLVGNQVAMNNYSSYVSPGTVPPMPLGPDGGPVAGSLAEEIDPSLQIFDDDLFRRALQLSGLKQSASKSAETMTDTVGTTTPTDPGSIAEYHVHVYYDPGNDPRPGRASAPTRRRRVSRTSGSGAGTTNWSDRTRARCIRSPFPAACWSRFLPWLMLNRDGLTILLHPQTGDGYRDHTAHAAWLGGTLPLRLRLSIDRSRLI